MSHVNDPMFGKHDIVTVKNPTDRDFNFSVDGEGMVVGAGETKGFPGMVANLYVKHMIDHLIISNNQVKKMLDMEYRKEVSGQIVMKVEKVNFTEPKRTTASEARQLTDELDKRTSDTLPEDKDFNDPEETVESLEAKMPKDEDLYPAPKKEEVEEEFPTLKEENLVKVEIPKVSELSKMNRKGLEKVAEKVGLNVKEYETNASLLDAIVDSR